MKHTWDNDSNQVYKRTRRGGGERYHFFDSFMWDLFLKIIKKPLSFSKTSWQDWLIAIEFEYIRGEIFIEISER